MKRWVRWFAAAVITSVASVGAAQDYGFDLIPETVPSPDGWWSLPDLGDLATCDPDGCYGDECACDAQGRLVYQHVMHDGVECVGNSFDVYRLDDEGNVILAVGVAAAFDCSETDLVAVVWYERPCDRDAEACYTVPRTTYRRYPNQGDACYCSEDGACIGCDD